MSSSPSLPQSLTESALAIAVKDEHGEYVLNKLGQSCARVAWYLSAHRLHHQRQEDLKTAQTMLDDRAETVISAIHDKYADSIVQGSAEITGGAIAVTGGIMMFTPLAVVGVGMFAAGTLVSSVSQVAGTYNQAAKNATVQELTTQLFEGDPSSNLLMALAAVVDMQHEVDPFSLSRSFEWIDLMVSYYIDHPEEVDENGIDGAANELHKAVLGVVHWVRSGYAAELSKAFAKVSNAKSTSLKKDLMTQVPKLTMIVGGSLAGTALMVRWAGSCGMQKSIDMAATLSQGGAPQAAPWHVKHCGKLINGAGVVAVVAGMAIIVVGIVDIIAAVKEKDELSQRTVQIREDLKQLLGELSSMEVVKL